jgi:hypothetical protein
MTNQSQAALDAETFDAIHRLILENPHLMRVQGIGIVKAAIDKAAADGYERGYSDGVEEREFQNMADRSWSEEVAELDANQIAKGE